MKILPVTDPSFQKYGQILSGYDLTELLETLERVTPLPEGVSYIPCQKELMELPAMEELSQYIGADRQAAVPQEGQHLAVDRYTRPAQHEGGHRQPSGERSVCKGGHPGGYLHQPGEQPLRPGLIHPQGGQQGGQQSGQCA